MDRLIFSFQKITTPCWMLKSILWLVHRWRKMALTIRFWLKVDYCFTIMSYDGLIYYLIFKWWLRPLVLLDKTNIIHMTTLNSEPQRLKYIMHKVQDYSIRYNNAVWPVINMWGSTFYSHVENTCRIVHFNKSGCLGQ
jgi:hypothetical protein